MEFVAIGFAVLCLICACMESKVIAPYKWFHVFGRVKAYLALDFLVGGVVLLGAAVLGKSDVVGVPGGAGIAIGAVLLALSVLLYWTTLRKCPDMLKKKCVISMIVTGLGVTMKICIFFISIVWKITAPKTVEASDGITYIVYDGDVYLPDGTKVGHGGAGNITVAKDDDGNPVSIQ